MLALLVAFPLMGLLAVSCIGLLVLQKLRLQTQLDDSSWWLISYTDITIIRESRVRTDTCISNWSLLEDFDSIWFPPGTSWFIFD